MSQLNHIPTDNNENVITAQYIPSELIQHILRFIVQPTDLFQCGLTCKSWSYHALELLWYKPYFARPSHWILFCDILNKQSSSWTFPYTSFIRRINLSSLSTQVKDEQLETLKLCGRLERVTLVGCTSLTDVGLVGLLSQDAGSQIMAIDLSDITNITDKTIIKIAESCPKLQGLNFSMCKDDHHRCVGVTDLGITTLAEHCRHLRRIKLNNCANLTDASAIALASKCPRLLEIDCPVTDTALINVFTRLHELREFRLQQFSPVTDLAFAPLSGITFKEEEPMTTLYRTLENGGYYDQLRILDLTNANFITDESLRLIVHAAPKIRNLVLNKCDQITDTGVSHICQLGRHLHYLHLGHCDNLTDASITQLARTCTRIRYLDLAQCSLLTDASVYGLATLPRLKRIGLVKCFNITDDAIDALTKQPRIANSLERVHLSYCVKLTVHSIRRLLNFCPRLNHLSLTHVNAFLRPDFQQFRRAPPKSFTPQQQRVFCVFSGKGVKELRTYLNNIADIDTLEPQHESDAAINNILDFISRRRINNNNNNQDNNNEFIPFAMVRDLFDMAIPRGEPSNDIRRLSMDDHRSTWINEQQQQPPPPPPPPPVGDDVDVEEDIATGLFTVDDERLLE
ncbi:uncharacterized protein BX664DRAFT_290886 [Halteromyces radiatus]|uniref:uncharacterized protein n=1 Tax=Halteromyces radiatus TaxID=101107 RepID=UPI00221FA167|nr:uncharacterized protein BX664DRAFT_290886 [Halteromyces radiatus]KAI8096161.1 hypothetical protein BX664DRAFT_290886 [Halteromyces radiatus]